MTSYVVAPGNRGKERKKGGTISYRGRLRGLGKGGEKGEKRGGGELTYFYEFKSLKREEGRRGQGIESLPSTREK